MMCRQHAILTFGGEEKNSVFRVIAIPLGPQVATGFYYILSMPLRPGDMIDLSIMKSQCGRLLGKSSHRF